MTKFDYSALKNHKVKTKINEIEMNKPNFEKMAQAFYNLYRQL
jgi:hypothetical protein